MKECFSHLEQLLTNEEKNYTPAPSQVSRQKFKSPKTSMTNTKLTSPKTTKTSTTPTSMPEFVGSDNQIVPSLSFIEKQQTPIKDLSLDVYSKQITLFKWKINLETTLRCLFLM